MSEIEDSLIDLFLAIHHKRAVLLNGLVQWLTSYK